MKDILFIAEYSPENIKIGEKLKELTDCKSAFALWTNKILEKSKYDYESIMNNSLISDFYIIEHNPNYEKFLASIINFVTKYPFEPSDIFIRGSLSQIWSISVAMESFLSNTNLHIILDHFERPLEEFEKKVLEITSSIFAMGPNAFIEEYSNKTINIFNKFQSNNFVKIPDFMFNSSDRKHIKTIISNNDNYLKYKESYKNYDISCINMDLCPENELSLYLMLSGYILDGSEDNEFGIILKKMGKAIISDFNKLDEGYDHNFEELEDKSLEEYAEYIVEIILKNISTKKGEIIKGHEIN